MVLVDILGGVRRYISGFGSMFKNAVPNGEEEEEQDDGPRLPRTKYGSELDLTGAAIALDTEPQHPPGEYGQGRLHQMQHDIKYQIASACMAVRDRKIMTISMIICNVHTTAACQHDLSTQKLLCKPPNRLAHETLVLHQ